MKKLYDAVAGMHVGSGCYPNDGWHYRYLRKAGDMARFIFDGEDATTPNRFMADARVVSVMGGGENPRYMVVG